MSPTRVRSLVSAWLSWPLLVAAAAACHVPNFRGPQVQNPPTGYAPRADAHQERRMFPDLDVTHRDAWVETSIAESGTIHINAHSGVLSFEDVQTARDQAMAMAAEGVVFGGLERLTVDEREAWGWSERRETVDTAHGCFRCELAGSCSAVCPKGVDPGLGVQLLKRAVLRGRAPRPS